MIRRKRFLRMTAATFAAILGCADPTQVTAGLELPEPADYELSVGEAVSIGDTGLTITLSEVIEDSRCPVDATCVWEGNLGVTLGLKSAGSADQARRLNTATDPAQIEVAGLTLTIVGATPEARAGEPTEAADYRVTVRVASVLDQISR